MNRKIRLGMTIGVGVLAGIFVLGVVNGGVAVHAQDRGATLGAVLDALIGPKQIMSIQPVSQWHERTVITPEYAEESQFPPAPIPVQAQTTIAAGPQQEVYYVLHRDDDKAAFVHEDGQWSWLGEEDLLFGPVESADYHALVNLNAIAKYLIGGADDLYKTSTINIHALLTTIAGQSAAQFVYQQAGVAPVQLELEIVPGAQFDSDGNALPNDLPGVIEPGTAWVARNTSRSVVAAALDFAEVLPRMPGQTADTVHLLPDERTLLALPTQDAFGLGDDLIAVAQTADSLDGLYDYEDTATALERAPGVWFERNGAPVTGAGLALLRRNHVGVVTELWDFAGRTGRLTLHDVFLDLEDDDARSLGLWRYPLALRNELLSDQSLGFVFSLPEEGRWLPMTLEADYDPDTGIMTGDITGPGAIMPMLVAASVGLYAFKPAILPAGIATPARIDGTIPVWMGDAPAAGLTVGEANARYALAMGNALNDLKQAAAIYTGFRAPEAAVDGYDGNYAATSIEDLASPQPRNQAFIQAPAFDEDAGKVAVFIRDNERPDNFFILEDAAEVKATRSVSITINPDSESDPAPDGMVALNPPSAELDWYDTAPPLLLPDGVFFINDETTAFAADRPEQGWYFDGWGAPYGGFGPLQLMLSADVALTAVFRGYTLYVTWDLERGNVTWDAPNRGRGYVPNSMVTLNAQPHPGYEFFGWSGDIFKQENSDKSELAIFVTRDAQQVQAMFRHSGWFTLTLLDSPGGHIEIDPALEEYEPGSVVTLTAVPDPLYQFRGWVGLSAEDIFIAPEPHVLELTMNDNKSIGALFLDSGALTTLRLHKTPGGIVELLDEPISEEDENEFVELDYMRDQEIRLRTVPDDHCRFWRWEGDNATDVEAGDEPDLYRITMNADKDLFPSFETIAVVLDGDDPLTIECGAVFGEVVPGASAVYALSEAAAPDYHAAVTLLEGWSVLEETWETLTESAEEAAALVLSLDHSPYRITWSAFDNENNLVSVSGQPVQMEQQLIVEDTTPPVITLLGDEEIVVECGEEFTDEGATAHDGCDGDLSARIVVSGDAVNTAVPGEYAVTYTVTDSTGNVAEEITRTITVADAAPPVITLQGDMEMVVECGGIFTDPGATAHDGCDGDLSDAVAVGGDIVNTAVPGEYVITYNVADSAGNDAVENTRTVMVLDELPPIITRLGAALIVVECGGIFTDLGATAYDICEGDLSGALVVGGDAVNMDIPGEYHITYNVADGAGNTAREVTCTVIVVDATPPAITLLGDAEVVIECGDAYEDAGALATDSCDGDLTDGIFVGGDTVDIGAPGAYGITYNVSDAAGNAGATVTRAITVQDTTAPVIALFDPEEDETIVVEEWDGETIAFYVIEQFASWEELEPGGEAWDRCDNMDLWDQVETTASVLLEFMDMMMPLEDHIEDWRRFTDAPGDYLLAYDVNDSAGNAADTVYRYVRVLRVVEGEGEPPALTYGLLIETEGEGQVVKSPDKNIFDADEVVSLHAIPAQGWVFARWEGALSGSANPATLIMDGDKQVKAVFDRLMRLTVAVEPPEAGTTIIKPAPYQASDDGSLMYFAKGTRVFINARPQPRYKFLEWQGVERDDAGGCQGCGARNAGVTISLVLDEDVDITAVFKRRIPWWLIMLILMGVIGAIVAVAAG